MGHTGTLDPLATGCMIIATDKSTKLIPYLEWKKKRYRFTVDMSQESDSLDLWTETRKTKKKWETIQKSENLIHFLENIKSQVPPIYSALRVDGKRAYEYARSGKFIDMKERWIEIENIYIHDIKLPLVDIELTISSGWYIRSLAPVIGNFFWYSGGCIIKLERTEIILWEKALCLSEARTLDAITGEDFLPYKELFSDIPFIEVSREKLEKLQNGIIPAAIDIEHIYWHKDIIFFHKNYYSLCRKTENGLKILKNDV